MVERSSEGSHVADEFESVLASVRDFVRSVVLPAEQVIEDANEIPPGIRAAAASMGLFGFALPERYGGLDLSMEQEARLVMELGYTTPAFRSMFGTNNGIAGHVILEGATERQRQLVLPRLASGDWTASFALTEAEAGSDPSGLATSARRDGDRYVLNGAKRYITNAPIADVFMVFARTSPSNAGSDGISCFLVPRDTAGLRVGPKDSKMGHAGAWTADVTLDDVVVGSDHLIGEEEGSGYELAMKCLAHGRLHIAALCVGISRRLLDEMLSHSTHRKQFGQAIASYQLIQALIADSQTDYLAAQALVLESSRAYDLGTDRRMGPAVSKYFASEAVGRIADRAVQVHGGAGYMKGVPVERFYRDVRLFRLYEGTSQIQQLIIARAAIKEYQAESPGASPTPADRLTARCG